jgi:RNA polymerase sigma factor (TIGR02999 family)
MGKKPFQGVDPEQTAPVNVTGILARASAGDELATRELFPLVYEELRRLAVAHLGHERPNHTLQPTALVHEAYLRLIGPAGPGQPGDVSWQNRAHFFGAAARAIRRILTDHARGKNRQKRGGGGVRLSLSGIDVAAPEADAELLALDEALEKLAALDAAKAKVVELRYFGGLSIEETAQSLGISTATVSRHWEFARVWLHRELRDADGSDGEGA